MGCASSNCQHKIFYENVNTSHKRKIVEDVTEIVEDVTEIVEDVTEIVEDVTEIVEDVTEIVENVTEIVENVTEINYLKKQSDNLTLDDVSSDEVEETWAYDVPDIETLRKNTRLKFERSNLSKVEDYSNSSSAQSSNVSILSLKSYDISDVWTAFGYTKPSYYDTTVDSETNFCHLF
jgi:coenzyme F420-reducing hydrogenase alpha subunit